MNTPAKKQDSTIDNLYSDAEYIANRYNVKCLFILAIMLVLCEVLNEIGIFIVPPDVMRIGCGCGMIFYLVPVLISRVTRNKNEIEHNSSFKYVIIVFTYLGTVFTCVLLTLHTILVMAIPILMIAQYRNNKRIIWLSVILSTICVFAGVYGGFFVGYCDTNLLNLDISDTVSNDLAYRWTLATPHRMKELLYHYVLPRELIIIALHVLANSISRHNNDMLSKQAELQSAVTTEMAHTNRMQNEIIDGMANLIENRDSSTGEHVKRTGFYVENIAHELQNSDSSLSDLQIDTIVRAAPLHDIGKIIVSDRILQKPGRLTPEEYEEIKQHSAEGARVVQNVLGSIEDENFLRTASDIAEYHHERWDGKGYPKGLKGEEIPLSARIMAVADVFDALVSKRVYKSPMPSDEAFKIIENESGKQFDPVVVAAFLRLKPFITASISDK